MSLLATAPLLLPLGTAALTALCAHRPAWQRLISFSGSVLLLIAALLLTGMAAQDTAATLVFGNWPEPFGIVFHLDRLGCAMILVSALMLLATLIYLESRAGDEARHPFLLPLTHGMMAGVCAAFATADLFNLYVWFEIMLICALGLHTIGARARELDATLKYLALNMFGTLLLLAAIGLIYAATGHLNFNALSQASHLLPPALLTLLTGLLLLALLLKAAAFPLYAWLPAAYPILPVPVLALSAGLLTKVGVYAILRLTGDVFATASLQTLLGWIAIATMVFGVLGAAYHWDMRRILAFHIISQIGYILLAIAIGDAEGQRAALFYTVHHIVVKANLFLIAGMICAQAGSFDLRRIGGLYATQPGLAILFAIPALSLVGIPPLSGFWSKLLVLQAAFRQGHELWAAIALLVSVLTLYSMLKIWTEAFWKPHPQNGWQAARTGLKPAWIACILLAAVTLWIGLNPQTLLDYAQSAMTVPGRP